jgi:hypothetical protein
VTEGKTARSVFPSIFGYSCASRSDARAFVIETTGVKIG